MTPSRMLALVVSLSLAVVALVLSTQFIENVDAHEIMVIQSPLSGNLAWYTTPGVKWQGFGKLTTYPKRSVYPFEIPVRFNDGGHGTMHGSIQYEMPLDAENLTRLHVRFGSAEAIQKQLIETVVNKSVYMTGPLMSSKESYAERRNYLIRYVEDQITHGVYKTISREVRMKDPMTGADKTVTVVEVVMKDGIPERQETAVLAEFGIRPFNFAIERLPYDEAVEGQIKQQQQITMDVQTAIADAKKAEQRTITVIEQGKADAAKAKWDQEVVKAKEVTAAEQRLRVAELDAQAAEQYRLKKIREADGDAEYKRRVMLADGALEPKLQALIKINELYADAIKNHPGPWVPSVVMGGPTTAGGGVPGGTAIPLIDLLTAKTARDLGIEMAVSGANRTKAGGQQ